MKFTAIGGATAILEHRGKRFMLDSWLVEGIFQGAWFHYPEPNLSVNYVDFQRDLPKGDDHCGKMVERNEAAFELFVADKQFAEAIEPAMADFDHPASGLLRRIAALDVSLLAAIDDMRDVAVRFDGAQVVCAAVSGIGAQVLAATRRGRRALDHDGAEDFIDALTVIDVGPGHDERQRDVTAVHPEGCLKGEVEQPGWRLT